jgi:uncharacterized membrane protein YhaH (DUF805 family)
MQNPLSFGRPIAPLPYATWVLGIFLSQHLVVLTAALLYPQLAPMRLDWGGALIPLHIFGLRIVASASAIRDTGTATGLLLTTLLLQLLVLWAFVALSLRRARDANWPGWIVILAVVPGIQLAVFLGLSFTPSIKTSAEPASASKNPADWRIGLQGLFAGVTLTVAAVALSTLAFGSYGYGLFLISPFVVGFATAGIANRRHDIGARETGRLVSGTMTVAGVALIAVAMEGAICLIMAAPIAVPMAWLGGTLGRAVALNWRNPARQTLASVAILPAVMAGEFLLAPLVTFETDNTISIAAPPARVWEALVKMERIDGPLPLGASMGIAYPLGAKLVGEGVGTTRLGAFSTGTAIEEVTEWDVGRKLTFTVLQDVPSMQELSPYADLHAPHSAGYFSTRETSFELLASRNGETELIERTSHVLRLEPVLYWLPLARIMVRQNNARILGWVKRQAEGHP